MIGNDLVDLEQAAIESNWKRKGYLAKIFTPSEQLMIDSSVMVWLLWSMKEAAYKIYSRQTGIRNYAPTSLNCSEINYDEFHITGIVKIEERFFFTQSLFKDSYVYTTAALSIEALSTIKTVIYQFPHHQFDYKITLPKCVSHHGKYLALAY